MTDPGVSRANTRSSADLVAMFDAPVFNFWTYSHVSYFLTC